MSTIQLPPPIALYVQLENTGDTETLSACFAPNAIVHDESRTYEGLAAITAWKAETKRKYHHTITPLAVASQQGKTVLKAQLTAPFPAAL
jgi:SnoaL-like domain